MEPIFYVMAILGCGEADTACQQVSLVNQRYASSEACNAATPDLLARHSDVEFPVVVAQCRRADAKLSETLLPADVDLPERTRPAKVRRASYEGQSLRG